MVPYATDVQQSLPSIPELLQHEQLACSNLQVLSASPHFKISHVPVPAQIWSIDGSLSRTSLSA